MGELLRNENNINIDINNKSLIKYRQYFSITCLIYKRRKYLLVYYIIFNTVEASAKWRRVQKAYQRRIAWNEQSWLSPKVSYIWRIWRIPPYRALWYQPISEDARMTVNDMPRYFKPHRRVIFRKAKCSRNENRYLHRRCHSWKLTVIYYEISVFMKHFEKSSCRVLMIESPMLLLWAWRRRSEISNTYAWRWRYGSA